MNFQVQGTNLKQLLGKLINSARIAKNLSLRDVALDLGCSPQTVASIELGETGNLEKIESCLDYLGTPSYFVRMELHGELRGD